MYKNIKTCDVQSYTWEAKKKKETRNSTNHKKLIKLFQILFWLRELSYYLYTAVCSGDFEMWHLEYMINYNKKNSIVNFYLLFDFTQMLYQLTSSSE